MWLNWLPWQYIVRRVARNRGFIDPISVLSHLHRFAQPSEVAAPLELLRAGVVFHARGLMNTGAIQHNLDWVWPYWVERQFDPNDVSFIPRAFSITHVNLTHRNWTAVGLPDCDWYPLVDPRGLLTPYWDSWSIDAWVIADDGAELLPSRAPRAEQAWEFGGDEGLSVFTQSAHGGLSLATRVNMELDESGVPRCREHLLASADRPAWLVVALRPANPEGVKFVHEIALQPDGRAWKVDGQPSVEFSAPVERHHLSTYRMGDVHTQLLSSRDQRNIVCDVGMATGAAMFRLEPGKSRHISLTTPFRREEDEKVKNSAIAPTQSWNAALRGHCQAQLPDDRFQFLYDAALRTLVLHSPLDVYPGPYTYKRFWYRDAAFIVNALLGVNLVDRARRALDQFPLRQTRAGYFLSQEGEWDSNGEALWIMQRYCQLTGEAAPAAWRTAVARGGDWIIKKRLSDQLHAPHAGLLPSGFSAEHLGPNDYYYWDDFWSVAGLQAGATLVETWGDEKRASRFRREADRLLAAIDRSLAALAPQRSRAGVPASPYRRMDPGAIGSLAVGYPLQLWSASDHRLLDTAEFLLADCFFEGGFFQDMIHSGINAYLTLHVAQVLLRAGDPRFFDLMKSVANLATSTGQWPEAIHPRTLGGCMGDGQHVWAAAEWALMLRNCFVREEAGRLIVAAGIPAAWLAQPQTMSLGPTPTPHGNVTITIEGLEDEIVVRCEGDWRAEAPQIEARLPGCDFQILPPGVNYVVFPRSAEAKSAQRTHA